MLGDDDFAPSAALEEAENADDNGDTPEALDAPLRSRAVGAAGDVAPCTPVSSAVTAVAAAVAPEAAAHAVVGFKRFNNATVVQAGSFSKYGRWETIELETAEPVAPEVVIRGLSVTQQMDDTYRNGPKGNSFNLTAVNIVNGKRERKVRVVDAPPTPVRKAARAPKPAVQYKKPRKAAPAEQAESMQLLLKGTASRGPLGQKPKTLSELYPWMPLSDEWIEKATSRLCDTVDDAWAARQSAVPEYAGGFPMVLAGPDHDRLRQMWNVCQSIPGEGGALEPLYGEINLPGTARMFAVWKECCGFGRDSTFLDVGSGLAKMVFHAAIDPGVRMSCGVEMSKYRHDTALSILANLLPKAGIADILPRVKLVHQDVKAADSWEGITHVYMFDLGFTSEQLKGPYPHILKLWMESSTAQHMITYRKPSFLWKRGFDLILVTKLRVKQQGNKSGSHLAYFYRKPTADETAAMVE